MTATRTRRYLALALLLTLFVLVTPRSSGVPVPTLPPVTEVVGSVPYAALGCAGCIAGGVLVTLGGWGSVLLAAARPGSALAVAGCAYACARALTH